MKRAPPLTGMCSLDTLYSGFSAGTELTFLKNTNPYLHSRWEAERGHLRRRRAERTLPDVLSRLHGGCPGKRRAAPKVLRKAMSSAPPTVTNPGTQPTHFTSSWYHCRTTSIRSSGYSSRRWARSPPTESCMPMRKFWGECPQIG